jgi:DNA primase
MEYMMYTIRKSNKFQVCYKPLKNKVNSFIKAGNFNRSLLPKPISVLEKLGIKSISTNSAGYLVCCCPFHQEKNPSFNIHSIDGHFKCHSCGVSGGDVIDFYQKKTGAKFIDAIKELGAWEVRS